MANKKSINRITLLNMIGTALLQGISFITAPLFSRILGTDNYGIYSIFITWTSVFANVFSLQTAASISVAPAYFPEEDQPKYQSSVLMLSLVAYGVFSVVVLLLLGTVSKLLALSETVCVLMLILGLAQACIAFANAKFTIEFRADNNLKLSLSSVLLGVGASLLLLLFVPENVNYYARMLGVTIAEGSLAVGLCIWIFRKGKTGFSKEYWKFCLPIAIPCIFHCVSGLILNQSDRVMIQQMMGTSQAGIYSLSYSFGSVTHIIYLALNNSWIPFYFEHLREGTYEDMRRRVRNITELFSVLCLGFLLLSPEVFHVFASEEYWEGGKYIPFFVVGNFFTFLYSFPVNFESFCKKTSFIAIATTIAAVANIVLNYLMILNFGVMGAVIATMIAHFLQFLVHYFSAKYWIKTQRYPISMWQFVPYTLAVVAVAAACFVAGDRFWILRWGLGAVLGFLEIYRIYKRRSIF